MNPKGFSLIEMVVVLILLGLSAGISASAISSLRVPATTAVAGALRAARGRALSSGRPVLVSDQVLFLPDGRAIGPGVDPLNGAPAAHAH
jgi:prepilin-type N-terminal cleavage/methylation domain-containing protein